MASQIEIFGLNEAAKAQFRADFTASARKWRGRAEEAGLAGRIEDAATCLLIAEIAARVAAGRGVSCRPTRSST